MRLELMKGVVFDNTLPHQNENFVLVTPIGLHKTCLYEVQSLPHLLRFSFNCYILSCNFKLTLYSGLICMYSYTSF